MKLVAAGVVLLRMAGLPAERKAEIVSSAVSKLRAELGGAFTVIRHETVRLRRLSEAR